MQLGLEQEEEQVPEFEQTSLVVATLSLQAEFESQATVQEDTGVWEQEAEQVPKLVQISVVEALLSLQAALEEQAIEQAEWEQEEEQVPGLAQASVVELLPSLQAASEEQGITQKEQEELQAPGLLQISNVELLPSSRQSLLLSQTTLPGQSEGQETQVSAPEQEPFPQQARVGLPATSQSGSIP